MGKNCRVAHSPVSVCKTLARFAHRLAKVHRQDGDDAYHAFLTHLRYGYLDLDSDLALLRAPCQNELERLQFQGGNSSDVEV